MISLRIVIDLRTGRPCALCHESRAFSDIPEGGILMASEKVTSFGDKESVDQAIKRTREYIKDSNGALHYSTYGVFNLEAVEL